MQQLGKLNASFGIGVIRSNLDNVYQSEVVIASRDNESLDLGMMDDLVKINPDFNIFIKNIHKTMKTDEPVEKHYDEVWTQMSWWNTSLRITSPDFSIW